MDIELTPVEARVLGALVEKSVTTPDYYPLSLNAVVNACNQRSNRDPVVDYDDATVIRAIDGLRDRGWTRLTHTTGQRAVKYRHVLGDVLDLDDRALAVLAVLMLRGDQTPGELRTRTGRYIDFGSLEEVDEVLQGLIERDLAVRMDRRPGEKENRYRQLLGAASAPDTGPDLEDTQEPDELEAAGLAERVEALEADVERLSADLRALRTALGED